MLFIKNEKEAGLVVTPLLRKKAREIKLNKFEEENLRAVHGSV